MSNPFLEIRGYRLTASWCVNLEPTPHIHKEIEIVYIKKGGALCYADNKLYKAEEGDMFIAFPNQVHYYLNSKLGEYALFIFSADILYNLKNIFFENIPDNNVIKLRDFSTLYHLLLNIVDATEPYKETVQVGLFNQFMPLYLSSVKLNNKTYSNSSSLQKILDFCSQNFTKEISLDYVANALHFSKYYVSRILNQKLNIGFNRYINTLRINKAMDFIQEGEENMTKIAEKIGFSTIRSFNRAFLEITNSNPREYRKQLLEIKKHNFS